MHGFRPNFALVVQVQRGGSGQAEGFIITSGVPSMARLRGCLGCSCDARLLGSDSTAWGVLHSQGFDCMQLARGACAKLGAARLYPKAV